jgi:hypothetical protein
MKIWIVTIGALAIGFGIGFYVGGMPLRLLASAHGGPLRASVESMEREVSVLTDIRSSRSKTPGEIVSDQVVLANISTVTAAISYCELSSDLRDRARAAAMALGNNTHIQEYGDRDSSVARQYLQNAGGRQPCEKFFVASYGTPERVASK